MGEQALFDLRNVHLSYGYSNVLDGVDFSLRHGEIHAIVGEHGAGKSSIARILAGLQKPDTGLLVWEGRELAGLSIKSATKLGIELVSQETELFQHQSVAENLFCNRKDIFPGFFYDSHRVLAEAQRYLASMSAEIDAHATMRSLSLPERVLVDILRHLRSKPQLLILDESLERLTAKDFANVRDALRRLTAAGNSVLFITHRIEDIYEIAQRVTIIRKGRRLITDEVSKIDTVSLIKLAYTQVSTSARTGDVNQEFYQFLKFNEAILERLPLNLIVVDGQNAIKLMNHDAMAFFGPKALDCQGQPVERLFDVDNEALRIQILGALLARRGDVLYNASLNLAGHPKNVDIVINPILDGEAYIGSMIIMNDRTEQEKILGQIAVSEKLASIGLLSAGVAHEINNPLETIYNYVDFLKLKISDKMLADTLGLLEEEVESIEHIVENLIVFSEDRAIEVERLDLGELLATLVALVLPNAKKRGVSLDIRHAADGIIVLANRAEMKQVVLNLIKNAFDAMPDGGALRIELAVETSDDIEWALLRVEDSGGGIDAESKDKIFFPFYSTKSQSQGHMGLGLSIIYGIVMRLRGGIEAENLSPSGCRFTVRIPISR
ncbi:MAG: ATP-binding cassette domain-containing protein [Treponema sp.]|nr:ATP-binding cassette domain-containing protein [Treponema sp.]